VSGLRVSRSLVTKQASATREPWVEYRERMQPIEESSASGTLNMVQVGRSGRTHPLLSLLSAPAAVS